MALRLARTRARHPPRRSQGSDTDSHNGKGKFGGFVRIPLFFCLNRVRLPAHTRALTSGEVGWRSLGKLASTIRRLTSSRPHATLDLGASGPIFHGPCVHVGFAEDEFVGRTLRIGSKVVIAVLERDPRCAMITIDPDTSARNTAILGGVTKAHDGKAGVYGAVLVEGHPPLPRLSQQRDFGLKCFALSTPVLRIPP